MKTLCLCLVVLLLPSYNYLSFGYHCPVVICPGFGNDRIDYETPLQQDREFGLIAGLERRGFQPNQIYTVPVKRSDWIKVAGGLLDIPDFYTNQAKPTGRGYGWYLKSLKETVEEAYENSGGERVLLLGHSAGGWLARAAMGNGEWNTNNNNNNNGDIVLTSDRIRGLATLGAIHKVPVDASTCVTRGALQYTDSQYPGAFLKKSQGIAYVSVGGAAIVGDDRKDNTGDLELVPSTSTSTSTTTKTRTGTTNIKADELYAKRGEGNAQRVAFNSYNAVCGTGNVIGDGVVPLEWTQLEGARQLELPGVLHSINEAGTTIPTDRWYGSEAILDQWLPAVMEETGLRKKKSVQPFSFAGLASLINRRAALQSALTVATTTAAFASSASAIYENAPIASSTPIALPSGVSYQDLRGGDGPIIVEGNRVNVQWVLKRSNGYTIDGSANHDSVPFIFVVGGANNSGQPRAIDGLDEGIRGMRVGGIRRIVIPPELSYTEGLEDGMPGPIPPEFGPKQRIKRVLSMIKDGIPGESFLLDVKATRAQY